MWRRVVVRMEKGLNMAPPEEQLREEGVLHLKESRDKGVPDVCEVGTQELEAAQTAWLWKSRDVGG